MSKEVITRNKSAAMTAIRDHYLNGTELTDKQEAIRARWSASFSLLCNYHSVQQAVPVLKKQFNISEGQAYRDINSAIRLFGNVLKSDKEGHRYIVYELAMKTYQVAAKNGDYKAMAASVQNMIKLLGLDREDPDLPDFGRMKPSINIITVSEELQNKIAGNMSAGPVVRKPEDYAEYTELNRKSREA
jgi:hypothetical protein